LKLNSKQGNETPADTKVEDVSFFIKEVPCIFMFLESMNHEDTVPEHSPDFS